MRITPRLRTFRPVDKPAHPEPPVGPASSGPASAGRRRAPEERDGLGIGGVRLLFEGLFGPLAR